MEVHVCGGLRAIEVPDVGLAEIHCFENALRFDLDTLRAYLERVLA